MVRLPGSSCRTGGEGACEPMSGGVLVFVDFQGENQEESSCWKVIVGLSDDVFERMGWTKAVLGSNATIEYVLLLADWIWNVQGTRSRGEVESVEGFTSLLLLSCGVPQAAISRNAFVA